LDEIRQGAVIGLKRRNKNGNHKKGSPAIKAGEPFFASYDAKMQRQT
jgi:hypothetical protein